MTINVHHCGPQHCQTCWNWQAWDFSSWVIVLVIPSSNPFLGWIFICKQNQLYRTLVVLVISIEFHFSNYVVITITYLATKTGDLPTASLSRNHPTWQCEYFHYSSPRPTHTSNPHLWRYRDKGCCHSKNICHCCFYWDIYWSGYGELQCREWYDCRHTGFLCLLLVILMWILVWPYLYSVPAAATFVSAVS